jgi:microcystin-dependent protein
MTEFQPDQPEDLIRSLVRRIGILERQGGTGTAISASTFTGKVEITAGSAAPTGWLLCDGTSYLRTDYPALFAAIGTTYGSVDGTHFNVPNAKGKVIVGRDAAQTEFDTLGETGGAKTHTLTTAQIPAHGHFQRANLSAIAAGGGGAIAGMTTSGGDVPGTPVQQSTVDTGGGGSHNNLQPYIVMNYVIKT